MKKLQTMLKNLIGTKTFDDYNGLDYKITKGLGISTYRDNTYLYGLRCGSKGYWALLNYILEKQTSKFNLDEYREIKAFIKSDVTRDTKAIMGWF